MRALLKYLAVLRKLPAFKGSTFVWQVESDLSPLMAADIISALSQPEMEPWDAQYDLESDRELIKRPGIHVGAKDKERYARLLIDWLDSARVSFYEPFHAAGNLEPRVAKALLLDQLRSFRRRVKPVADPVFQKRPVELSGK